MRREVRILLATLAVGAAWTWRDEVPAALSRVDTFRVKDVHVRGTRYLSRSEVIDQMGVSPRSSVWADPDEWEEALTAHPLVRQASVRRRVPDRIEVSIEERRPVALVPTPTLEPVDPEGVRLPLDPAEHRLDLPLVQTDRPPAAGSRLLPERTRLLVSEVGRLTTADTAFQQSVSEIRWASGNALVARWADPDVEFLVPLGAPPERLREGLAALAHAAARSQPGTPASVDLRFAGLVVVRRTTER